MSGTATKRQLSNSSTPSPICKKVVKLPKMDGKIPHIGLDTGKPMASQDNSQDESNINSFEYVFGRSEEQIMNMTDEVERWQFMMSALKLVAKKFDNLNALENENKDLKYTIQSVRGKITRLENDLDRAQKKNNRFGI